jgi:GDP-D-mannose dehydratase
MSKVALITGITGQDGSYLTELLLAEGYTVHGLIRRASTFHTERIDHLYQDPHDPDTRLFLHYGDLSDSSQITNLFYEVRSEEVYHLGAQSHVRVSFDMPDYTGDITGLGTVRLLFLGNLEARRDWGSAPEYVDGMWRMLQQEESQDLVFGTGETHSVQEFVEAAFRYVNLDWQDYMAIDPRYLRPTEVPLLQANPSEAKRCLGWEPQVRFKELVRIMMDADLEAAGLPAPGGGSTTLPMDGLSG